MNYTDERICSIALTLCTGIGALTAQRLVQMAGSAAAVFSRREELARTCPDIQPAALKALDTPGIFARAEQELDFADKHGIACLTLQDDRYPTRLRQCEDAPLFLFYSGTGNLNSLRVVSMVGTRNATDYGRQWCNSFIRDLATLCPDLLVVSGLAYGIDIASHRAALAHHVPTVAVLAHGLDRIYPAIHRKTATEMLAQGGLLTEFLTGTDPERYNFLSRNRLVAGLSQGTIVVESGIKGGSLVTADIAASYNKELFALPGPIDSPASEGTNMLIRTNQAILYQSVEDIAHALNWQPPHVAPSTVESLSPRLRTAYDALPAGARLDTESLAELWQLPLWEASSLIGQLRAHGLLAADPYKCYYKV